MNPVWSPDGSLIIYAGAQVNVVAPLLAVHPDGDPVELPEIKVFRSGERMRFLPDGSGLVYMQGNGPSQDFWLLDLATMKSRRLTQLDSTATMRTFAGRQKDRVRSIERRLGRRVDRVEANGLIHRRCIGVPPIRISSGILMEAPIWLGEVVTSWNRSDYSPSTRRYGSASWFLPHAS